MGNQWWVFDGRTHTIRVRENRHLVIGTYQAEHDNFLYRASSTAVVRPYSETIMVRTKWYAGSGKNIRNLQRNCLWVYGNSPSQHQYVTWQTCNAQDGQGWYYDEKDIEHTKFPVRDGVKFQIRSKQEGHRTVQINYNNQKVSSHEYYVIISDHDPYFHNQWWVYDSRTHTIRSHKDRNLVLRIRIDYNLNDVNNYNNGQYAVAGPYRSQLREQLQWFEGARMNLRTHDNTCLWANGNSHYSYVQFYTCQNNLNQGWWID